MKVTLPKDYRKMFTLEELDIARTIIRDMKEDTSTPAEYIVYAVYDWLDSIRANAKDIKDYDFFRKVLSATATPQKNRNAWDAYGEGTQHMDIWIDAIVRTSNGFLVIGAYLTDIWSISEDCSMIDRYYTRYYKEV